MPYTMVIVATNGLDRDFHWDKNKALSPFWGAFLLEGLPRANLFGPQNPKAWDLVWDEDKRLLLVRIAKSR